MSGITIVWNWFRNFFGDAVLIFAIVGAVLVLIEACLYRRRRGGKPASKSAEELLSLQDNAAGSVPASSAVHESEGQASVKKPAGKGVNRTGNPDTRKLRIAVITGASSGMGAEFARQVDASEREIDQIWLIARRQERMEKVASGLKHKVKIFPMDLTIQGNFDKLSAALKMADVEVGLLINCAGYGKIGNYASLSREESNRLIDLNCKAAVDTTLTVLPFMAAGDRIIEICSTAAFQPLQHFNLYAASKSFLYYYCRALRMELLPRRISVMALCPYWVKDTEFISIARDGEKKNGTASAIRSFPLSTTSAAIVRRALRSSRAGFAVSTPGIVCTLHRIFSKVLSKESLLYIWEGLRRI